MKRLLSAILTLALVISLVPAVFAGDTELKEQTYTFSSPTGKNIAFFRKTTAEGYEAYKETGYFINSTYKEDNDGRNWRVFDIDSSSLENITDTFSFGLYKDQSSMTVNNGISFALALKATQTGFYIPKIKLSGPNAAATGMQVKWFISDKRVMNITSGTIPKDPTEFSGEILIYTKSGEELISAFNANKNYRINGITFEPVQDAYIIITADKTELNTTDNITAIITNTTVKGDNLTGGMPVAGGFVKYYSDNTAVATVDADTGVITAVATGTANIYAQSPDGVEKSEPITVTVTAPEPEEPDYTTELNNAFAHESTTANAVTVPTAGVTVNTYVYTVDGTKKNLDATNTIPAGTAYEVDADKITGMDGYEFLYWAKGMAMDKKQIVSGNAKYSFIPTVEATHLIAVFAPTTAEGTAKAEFYNGNGQLLPDYSKTGIENVTIPELPSMAGYGDATHWELYGDTTATEYTEGNSVALSGSMIFVAQYKDLEEKITVTVNGGSCDKTAYKYGDVVTCTPTTTENFVGWMKDGVIVSMDKNYTFNAWENCDVEAVYGEHSFNGPATKLLIDIFNDKFIMAEFIGLSNYGDVVEKGIMIGNKRFAMQKPLATQFTLEAEDATEAATAVAYAIFSDGTMITDK